MLPVGRTPVGPSDQQRTVHTGQLSEAKSGEGWGVDPEGRYTAQDPNSKRLSDPASSEHFTLSTTNKSPLRFLYSSQTAVLPKHSKTCVGAFSPYVQIKKLNSIVFSHRQKLRRREV